MTIEQKQKELKEFLANIDDTVTLEFKMSKRWKRALGRAYQIDRRIEITRYCFKFTLDSMKDCLLHELAHIYQYDMTGISGHNKEFREIRDMLLQDYGTKEIMAANRSKTLVGSLYNLEIK